MLLPPLLGSIDIKFFNLEHIFRALRLSVRGEYLLPLVGDLFSIVGGLFPLVGSEFF
jgi:hypothetical protein